MNERIYVDQQLFFGRVREQREFRTALMEVLAERDDDGLPYVVLLYGDGGIGKTTLSKRLRDIAMLEPPFEGGFECLWIDWETERKRTVELQVGRAFIQPETVFDVIHRHGRARWSGPLFQGISEHAEATHRSGAGCRSGFGRRIG